MYISTKYWFFLSCQLLFFLGFYFALFCFLVFLGNTTRRGRGKALLVIHKLSAYVLVKRSERLYPSRGRTYLSQQQRQNFNRISVTMVGSLILSGVQPQPVLQGTGELILWSWWVTKVRGIWRILSYSGSSWPVVRFVFENLVREFDRTSIKEWETC